MLKKKVRCMYLRSYFCSPKFYFCSKPYLIMKKIYACTFLILMVVGIAQSQTYLTKSFSYGGVNRQYLLYVPASYQITDTVPFVVALHGLGDNMNSFKNINFKSIADTAKFIFAIPQALVDNLFTGATAWNSGAGAFGISLNASVDDVGFLNALMDTVSAKYNIDQSRIFATGFSMGGFMSNRLACELNNRVAAIASVSGTIGGTLNCQPGRAIPVAHFHGTADSTIAYSGGTFGNDPEELVKYWVNNNGCDTTAIIDSIPNTKNDGRTVVHYKYPNGRYNTEVEFFKVVGGTHQWLTSANDITYSVEIWRFFSRFRWTAQQQTTGIATQDLKPLLAVYPNPAQNEIQVSLNDGTLPIEQVTVADLTGRIVSQTSVKENTFSFQVNTSAIANGVYILRVDSKGYGISKKIVISK